MRDRDQSAEALNHTVKRFNYLVITMLSAVGIYATKSGMSRSLLIFSERRLSVSV